METKPPKCYVMHPSSARRSSNLCHLQTFCPFLSFPSVSEAGCQLTGQKPISQSTFLPFPWEARLPGWAEAAECPARVNSTPAPQEQGWHPEPSPDQTLLQGSSPISHNSHCEGWEGSSSLQGPPECCPSTLGCPQSQHTPCSSLTRLQIKFFNSKTTKAVVS